MPVRGCSSISRTPAARSSSSVAATSSTRYATWCRPGPRLARKRPDRRVGGQRRQQLDVAVADVEQRGLDALLVDRLAVHERHPVGVAVDGDRGVEILDRDADVVDAAEHGGECTLSRPCGSPSPPTAPPAAGSTRRRWLRPCAQGAVVAVFGCQATISSAPPTGARTAWRWPAATGRSAPWRSWRGAPRRAAGRHPDRHGQRLRARPRPARRPARGRRARRRGQQTRPLELGPARRRPAVRERRQRRARVGRRPQRAAAQAAARPARLRGRRRARGRPRAPARR